MNAEHGAKIGREQEIARYVEQVRRALADLPPRVRDELLEDLPEHLAEVAAEADGPLADRLGPPEAYAAELRGAVGTDPPAGGRNLDQRIAAAVGAARGRLRAVDARVGPLIGYARASEYLRLLRPAWWVLRGYLVAMLITVATTGSSFGLLPRLGGSTLAAVLLLTATVVGSVWLGRRSDRFGPRSRLVLHGSALVLAIFAFFAFVDLDSGARSEPFTYQPAYGDPYSTIQDVYVYDSQGRLVEGARLFDQNGQPIQLGYPWCDQDQQFPGEATRRTYPYCPEAAPFRFGPAPRPAPSAAPAGPGPAVTPSLPESAATPGSTEPTATPAGPGPTATTGPPEPTPTG